MIGSQDLLLGLVIAVFFFGAKRLPEIAGALGKSMKEFKKGVNEGERDGEVPAAASAVLGPCPSCRAPLEPSWAHCPQCGAVVRPEVAGPPDSLPPASASRPT
jgi:sec-independent protein translocase protein TatA